MEKIGQPKRIEALRRTSIRLGYVRLLDAAPIIMGEALGYYESEGLRVQLSKEVGWATIRDKLAFGELDAVHGPSPLGIAMKLGVGVTETELRLGMNLSWGGNAIILSNQIREAGCRQMGALKSVIKKLPLGRKIILGTVSNTSCHYLMLRRWLESEGLDGSDRVILTVLPPEQMVRNLRAGNIDGYCVGEPWGSVAISEGFGWAIALSEEVLAGYPEKGLWISNRFSQYHPDGSMGLIRALRRACLFCSEEANTEVVTRVLSNRRYLNCDENLIRRGLSRTYERGNGAIWEGALVRFDGEHCPKRSDGNQLLNDLQRYRDDFGSGKGETIHVDECFSESLYVKAMNLILESV